MADSNLVARLRLRLIVVPKQGTEPFVPTQPFWVTTSVGSINPGESAGLQYLPDVLAGPRRVQEHVYEIEPLSKEAADALAEQAETIERLRVERDEWAAKWHKVRAELAELKYPGMKGIIRPADDPASPVSR